VIRRAFSLLEALVAVAIATAFLGAIAVFTSNLGDARARLARSSREIECAEAVFSALERACATVVLDAAGAGDGIEGDAARLRMVRSGVGLGDDGSARFGEFVAGFQFCAIHSLASARTSVWFIAVPELPDHRPRPRCRSGESRRRPRRMRHPRGASSERIRTTSRRGRPT